MTMQHCNEYGVTMLDIIPIKAFEDNYIWLLRNDASAAVVDPGDAAPVMAYLDQHQLQLKTILITHHHSDHIGGVSALIARYPDVKVYAPKYGDYAFAHKPVKEADTVNIPELGLSLGVMWLPGHTLDHIAFVNNDYLFCGDTLFSAGCGRLFEGSPQQMLDSLNRLKALPVETKVFCTHEYTAKNIAFALTIDPKNEALLKYQRHVKQLNSENSPSLPSTIAKELSINPFFRCNETTIHQYSGAKEKSEIAVFTAIRNLRNKY